MSGHNMNQEQTWLGDTLPWWLGLVAALGVAMILSGISPALLALSPHFMLYHKMLAALGGLQMALGIGVVSLCTLGIVRWAASILIHGVLLVPFIWQRQDIQGRSSWQNKVCRWLPKLPALVTAACVGATLLGWLPQVLEASMTLHWLVMLALSAQGLAKLVSCAFMIGIPAYAVFALSTFVLNGLFSEDARAQDRIVHGGEGVQAEQQHGYYAAQQVAAAVAAAQAAQQALGLANADLNHRHRLRY